MKFLVLLSLLLLSCGDNNPFTCNIETSSNKRCDKLLKDQEVIDKGGKAQGNSICDHFPDYCWKRQCRER